MQFMKLQIEFGGDINEVNIKKAMKLIDKTNVLI